MGNQFEAFTPPSATVGLDDRQPESLRPLLEHVVANIRRKAEVIEAGGGRIEVLDPEWCRANPAEAGQMHADVIVGTYGNTYALPNKDPEANRAAIEDGGLDVYLMRISGQLTGTACMVNEGNGRGELGRSASVGRSGNGIIQDLRIFDWLSSSEAAAKYHTLVATLRSAPDRAIENGSGSFVMRGGQAVTEHWRKLPGVVVNGFGPLYLKHGMLEQFTVAAISRARFAPERPLYVADDGAAQFVTGWHGEYGLAEPKLEESRGADSSTVLFEAHIPPADSGIVDYVHADVVSTRAAAGKQLADCLAQAEQAGSPFTQVVMPIEQDTRDHQAALEAQGYQVFGYNAATDQAPASLLYGRPRGGLAVVQTYWAAQQAPNPFWRHQGLQAAAEATSRQW